jgi:hypothetical protein
VSLDGISNVMNNAQPDEIRQILLSEIHHAKEREHKDNHNREITMGVFPLEDVIEYTLYEKSNFPTRRAVSQHAQRRPWGWRSSRRRK